MHTAEYTNVETPLALLVAQAKEGDPEAWEEIIARFTWIVDINVRRITSDYHTAEEMRQDVFVHAFEKIGTLRESAALPNWLRTIARRMTINRITRGPREQAIDWIGEVGQDYSDTPDNPVDILIMRECADNLHAAMRTLKPMDHDAINAFYFDGQTYDEMTDRFRIPMGTLKRRLHVARRRLRARLKQEIFS